jgi:hypothetical protein
LSDSTPGTSPPNGVSDLQLVQLERTPPPARFFRDTAFFLSIEFQRTGYPVYRTYASAFGPPRIGLTVPLTRSEFIPDVQRVAAGVVVGATGWEALLDANQMAYFNEFVQRSNFVATYPSTLANSEFVAALNANAGNVLSTSERDQLVQGLNSGAKT